MKKLGDALAIYSVLGAIVDIHGEQKYDHIHDDNEGNEKGYLLSFVSSGKCRGTPES